MRYIVRATRLNEFDTNVESFRNIVYDGTDMKRAREAMSMYSQYGGTQFESRDE